MATLKAVRSQSSQERLRLAPRPLPLMYWVPLLGRVLFSAIFIFSSFSHFTSGAVGYAAKAGVPAAGILVPFSGLLALVGGVSVLLGFRARIGALFLVLFLVPVTLKMHAFWASPDPATTQLQQAMFFKNLAMIGGALFLMYFGSGPLSLDSRLARAEQLRR